MTDPKHLTNSILSTATSLLTLHFPPNHAVVPEPHKPAEKEAIATELRKQVIRVAADDFSDLESMLACQAHLLHQIFMDSSRKYAANAMAEHSRIFGGVALKSQNYCRMTISALSDLKARKDDMAFSKNSRNELNRKLPYAPLDERNKTASTGADEWTAALEDQLWRENF